MKTIDLTEYGSNIVKTVLVHNIKTIEALTYIKGPTVTLISFLDGTDLHVNELVDKVKLLINQ